MTIREFNEWVLYAEIEPFEEQRADWRTAHVVATLVSIFRKKGSPAAKVKDYVLQFVSRWREILKPKQTWQEQKAIGYQWYLLSLDEEERRKKEQEKNRAA